MKQFPSGYQKKFAFEKIHFISALIKKLNPLNAESVTIFFQIKDPSKNASSVHNSKKPFTSDIRAKS